MTNIYCVLAYHEQLCFSVIWIIRSSDSYIISRFQPENVLYLNKRKIENTIHIFDFKHIYK